MESYFATAMDSTGEIGQRLYCGPSEDIWEKFGLLPTPPRSPNRTCSDDETEHKLLLVSDLLDNPELCLWGFKPQSAAGLKNDLLHDCMWSGQCTDACKRGHGSDQEEDVELTAVTSEPAVKSELVESSGAAKKQTEPSKIGPSPALPVDPCTMLPYTPLSDHSYHNQYQLTAVQPRTPPVCDTPSDTEDEIDVVTLPTVVSLTSLKSEPVDVANVNKTCRVSSTKRRPGRPQIVPPLRVVIRTSNIVSKHKGRRKHSRKRFQKRLVSSASSKSISVASNGGWTRRHYKRHFSSHKQHANRTDSCSSDSEDCVEKRTMHNSMERKRRDDLRYAFQNLREHVPELASNPKAPKVLILNRAASYARQLSQTGAALEKALKQETRRRHELQKKLVQLSKLQ